MSWWDPAAIDSGGLQGIKGDLAGSNSSLDREAVHLAI